MYHLHEQNGTVLANVFVHVCVHNVWRNQSWKLLRGCVFIFSHQDTYVNTVHWPKHP